MLIHNYCRRTKSATHVPQFYSDRALRSCLISAKDCVSWTQNYSLLCFSASFCSSCCASSYTPDFFVHWLYLGSPCFGLCPLWSLCNWWLVSPWVFYSTFWREMNYGVKFSFLLCWQRCEHISLRELDNWIGLLAAEGGKLQFPWVGFWVEFLKWTFHSCNLGWGKLNPWRLQPFCCSSTQCHLNKEA